MTDFDIYKNQINEIKKEGKRPSLLLHVCCGPCSCHILTYLSEIFDITVYYSNDNIYPSSEFEKRLDVLKTYIDKLDKNIRLVIGSYNHEEYLESMKDVFHLAEFTDRCWTCYRYRIDKSFKFAKENNFDYCTTVMSVSRYKNSDVLNRIGEELEKKYGIKYLHADFKKEKGEELANKLAKQENMYRQSYCGCERSLMEHESRTTNK